MFRCWRGRGAIARRAPEETATAESREQRSADEKGRLTQRESLQLLHHALGVRLLDDGRDPLQTIGGLLDDLRGRSPLELLARHAQRRRELRQVAGRLRDVPGQPLQEEVAYVGWVEQILFSVSFHVLVSDAPRLDSGRTLYGTDASRMPHQTSR